MVSTVSYLVVLLHVQKCIPCISIKPCELTVCLQLISLLKKWLQQITYIFSNSVPPVFHSLCIPVCIRISLISVSCVFLFVAGSSASLLRVNCVSPAEFLHFQVPCFSTSGFYVSCPGFWPHAFGSFVLFHSCSHFRFCLSLVATMLCFSLYFIPDCK